MPTDTERMNVILFFTLRHPAAEEAVVVGVMRSLARLFSSFLFACRGFSNSILLVMCSLCVANSRFRVFSKSICARVFSKSLCACVFRKSICAHKKDPTNLYEHALGWYLNSRFDCNLMSIKYVVFL